MLLSGIRTRTRAQPKTTSLTYGVLPSREAFDSAFDMECPRGYRLSLGASDSRTCDGFKLGDGTWNANDLWEAISEIVNHEGDAITVSEDEEFEDVYQVFYPGTDRPYVEIGPDNEDLIAWANKFSQESITSETRAKECLNFAAAYGETGKDFTRTETALTCVSGCLGTLHFEWI